MIEPSHEPCPMCGHTEEEERIAEIQELAEKAVNNLKFLNLGFTLGYFMTDFERMVYFHHQIRKDTFKVISEITNKSEGSIKMAWNRCKVKGDKALAESQI